jgi:hypothetical protein
MNYQSIYNRIIDNAKLQIRSKNTGYFESHHIIPKALGGDNSKSNLILLTAREHFICHFLLVKLYPKNTLEYQKMLHAFMLMRGMHSKQSRYINSKLYQALKADYAILRSKNMKGKKLSSAHKQNISNAMIGRKLSDESKLLISQKASQRKRKPFSDDYKKRMSEIMQQRNRWKSTRLA